MVANLKIISKFINSNQLDCFSWLLLAREAGASKRLPCLAERAGSPGKGTPVRVGNLPMKSECVHTKALTPGGSRTP